MAEVVIVPDAASGGAIVADEIARLIRANPASETATTAGRGSCRTQPGDRRPRGDAPASMVYLRPRRRSPDSPCS